MRDESLMAPQDLEKVDLPGSRTDFFFFFHTGDHNDYKPTFFFIEIEILKQVAYSGV